MIHHVTSYNSNITPPLSCWHFNLWGWFLPGAAQPLLYRSDPLRVACYQLKEWLKNQFSFICYLFFSIHVSFIGGQEMSLKHFTTWFRNISCAFQYIFSHNTQKLHSSLKEGFFITLLLIPENKVPNLILNMHQYCPSKNFLSLIVPASHFCDF